VDIKKEYTSVN